MLFRSAFVSLLGPVERVYARLRQREAGPPPIDTAVVALEFANGVTGTLATVRATPFYWRVHLFGTDGSAEVLDETTMILRKSGAAPQRPAVFARLLHRRRRQRQDHGCR